MCALARREVVWHTPVGSSFFIFAINQQQHGTIMSKPSSSSTKSTLKNVVSAADRAVLEERYEFVPSEKKKDAHESTWQDRMVQRYHDGLYKEFALADLSRPGQLGLRWRTRQEVLDGRGERSCGNKRCVNSRELSTIEVPFAYQEGGVQKKELVKLRLCATCLPLVSKKKSHRGEEKVGKSSKDSSSEGDVSSSEDESSDERRKRKKHKVKLRRRRKKTRKRSRHE